MLEIELSEAERALLRYGINEWGGPAACTDELAVAMGFAGRDDFHEKRKALHEAVRSAQPLSARNWSQVLVMTEFVFISDTFGSGHDWLFTTGLSDVETIDLLRSVQRKFSEVGAGRSAFAPSSHQEYQWQSSAATALRMFRGGRTSVDELLGAIDSTVEGFTADLEDLKSLSNALHTRTNDPEEQRIGAANADIEHLARQMETREGHRRMFWL